MQKSAQAPPTVSPTSSTDFTDTVPTKTSVFEKQLLKRLYGHTTQADDSVLPVWYKALFQAHQDDKDRDHIVDNRLSSTSRFEDVEMPIYPELKKWFSSEIG